MKKWLLYIAATVVVAFVLLCSPFGEPLVVLVFGWLLFLNRVLPQLTWSSAGLIQAVVALALLVVLAQWFLRWLYAAVRSEEGRSEGAWRFRWTAASLAIVFLMFVAGISMVAVVHQTYWIATSNEPLMTSGIRPGTWRHLSKANLRDFGFAIDAYQSKAGHLPAGTVFNEQGKPLHGWAATIVPYMDVGVSDIDRTLPWNDPKNRAAFQEQIDAFINPTLDAPYVDDDDGYSLSHYAANGRVMGGGPPMRLDDITDGAANTILLGEVNHGFRPWGHPFNWRDPALGLHVDGGFGGNPKLDDTLFVMGDGHVRHVSNDVDPLVLRALATPAGDEPTQPE